MTDLVVPEGATWADLRAALTTVVGGPRGPAGEGAVVVATSGSSGTPKRVRLPGHALRSSGLATAELLGGHGRWVLALPPHHVAGLQVLARSALAGTDPVALEPGMPFTPAAFSAAVDALGPATPHAPLRITSLVPTQLRRLVDDGAGRAALARLDVVLVGGSAADPALLDRGRATGCRVLHTYGMSETSGGCVYDGRPLPGVRVRLDPRDQRVHLGGPVLADGYVDQPRLTAERFVEDEDGRWFVTDDRGSWEGDRLVVLGRVDDVIVTGGHKVEPRDVEAALRGLPGVTDALVLAVPDAQWGQLVGALVVTRGEHLGDDLLDPLDLRDRLRPRLPAHALPRRIARVDGIPQLATGKPDRAAAAELLVRGGRMEPLPPT